MRIRGTRAQVMNGTALKTPGGLKKKDLKYNKMVELYLRNKVQLRSVKTV